MSKKIAITFFVVLAANLCAKGALSYPVTTLSPSEAASQVSTEVAEKTSLKERIKQTTDKINENAMFGVVGMLKGIVTGDNSEIMKNAKKAGYEVYKAEQEKRKKAKEEAQEEAEKQAKEKLEAKEEGEEAAAEAIDENRKKTKENLAAKAKRAYSWAKKNTDKAKTWVDKQATSAGNWVADNREGLDKITSGVLGDSASGSYAGKAIDALSKKADNGKDKDKSGSDDKGNKNSD